MGTGAAARGGVNWAAGSMDRRIAPTTMCRSFMSSSHSSVRGRVEHETSYSYSYLLTYSRTHVLTCSRTHVLTCLRAYVLTCLRT